jgi:hypothetical protein
MVATADNARSAEIAGLENNIIVPRGLGKFSAVKLRCSGDRCSVYRNGWKH